MRAIDTIPIYEGAIGAVQVFNIPDRISSEGDAGMIAGNFGVIDCNLTARLAADDHHITSGGKLLIGKLAGLIN